MIRLFHRTVCNTFPLLTVGLFIFSVVASPFLLSDLSQSNTSLEELIADDGYSCVGSFQQGTKDSQKVEGDSKTSVGMMPSVDALMLEVWTAHRLPNSTHYSSRLLYTQITSSYL